MADDRSAKLTLASVRFGYPGRPSFLGPIDLRLNPGECWAIVGPNGAGKTTLLRLMAGLIKPQAGRIEVCGQSLRTMSGRRRAQYITYVPQQTPGDLNFPAREVVVMGRFPHRSFGLFESVEDRRIAEEAMTETGTLEFAERSLATLSGGETQRVHLAAAIAQRTRIMLFDEPTASLDLKHQLDILGILRDRAVRDGSTVVVVTHDVNLAARFCSHVLLMHEGQAVTAGRPDEVITPEVLKPVYGVNMMTLTSGDERGDRWVVPVAGSDQQRAEAP